MGAPNRSAESGVKRRQILRRFHPDVQLLRALYSVLQLLNSSATSHLAISCRGLQLWPEGPLWGVLGGPDSGPPLLRVSIKARKWSPLGLLGITQAFQNGEAGLPDPCLCCDTQCLRRLTCSPV